MNLGAMNVMVSLGIALGTLVLVVGVLVERRSSTVRERLQRYAQPSVSLEDVEMQAPISERVFLPWIRRVAGMLFSLTPGSQVAATRRNLATAGMAGKLSVASFQTRRFVLGLGLGGGLAFIAGVLGQPITISLAVGLPLAALGYMYPSMWLGKKIKARQKAIQRSLPDAIDLLTVCVEAGSGFDAALARVVAKWKGPLAEEFERLLADLRMGRNRRDALKDMGDRTGVQDVQSFVSALIQADILGVGLVRVLRVQAEQMRQKRRLRAEEQAAKAPIKMLLPMILLIFPAVYIVILGPAMLQLMAAFGG